MTMNNGVHIRPPQLLVHWERPARSFIDAVRPALSRSPRPRDGEIGHTGVPRRAILASTLGHLALVLVATMLVPTSFRRLTVLPADHRIYSLAYLPTIVPMLDDKSGAEEGRSGAAGGQTAFHPLQAIRASRSAAQVPMVYNPPKLTLPSASSGFMNLLVMPAPPAVPLPNVPDVTLKSRITAPQQVDAVPPPPSTVSLATMNSPFVLPELVPPPPTISSARSKHIGELPAEVTEPVTPRPELPASLASLRRATEAGFLISAVPGVVIGAPADAAPGTLAMSVDGNGVTGAGGRGGGAGTGRGLGTGSGTAGRGPGSGFAKSGYGADQAAEGGIAAGSGPGGTGNSGNAATIGVSIGDGPPAQPGTIYISSWGGPPPRVNSGTAPEVISHVQVPLGPRRQPAITVIATPSSGGGMSLYGILSGARVYTTYLDTVAGAVILQYADTTKNEGGYDGDLVAPDPLDLALPENTPVARVIVSCTINSTGVLQAFRIVEASDTSVATRLLAALAKWRFRPVLREDTPIAVSAVIGFHVGTH